MDVSNVSQYMSLSPDMLYKATKMAETVVAYFPGDTDSQEKYLRENLIDQSLEYALTLLENKKLRDYMGTAVYTDGRSFSAPTLALYNVASMPEMKQRIQAKLNAKGNVRKEEIEVIDEKKRPTLKGRKFNGKNPWWNSDGDDKPYEPGDDVKKTRKESIDYVAELWKGRHGQSDTEYQAGRSDAGKRISGDANTGPRYYTLGRSRGAKPDAPTAPGAKPVNSPKMSGSEKEYHQYNKSAAKRRSEYSKVGGSKGLPGSVNAGYEPEGEMVEAWYSGEGTYRTTASGRKVRRDEDDNTDNMVSDRLQKKREDAARAAATAKLAAKGNLPIRKPKVTEDFNSYVESIQNEGYDLSEWTWEGLEEFYISETKNKEGKEQGADGKACWKGYKYAGTANGKDKCVKMEDVAEIATEYFMNEGLNEYGIDILIEEMGLDDFGDFVYEISDEYFLTESRTLVGKKKTAATGKARGVSLKAAPGKTTKAGVQKYGTTRKLSGLSSSGTIKKVAKKQPETKSTPVQTKEKSKGGILGALKARAQKDIASVRQSVNTAKQVGIKRAAEVKATYDAIRAKGKEAEGSAGATRARRQATVATGRAAQAAGRTAIKAAGAAGAAAGQAVAAKRSGKSNAAAAGRAVGTFLKKMTKEERELLTQYFIESEIAINYDEVYEIFESLDQEHFDYFLNQATLMLQESGPTALELIEQKLQNAFDIEKFAFANWRKLTEKKSSNDDATGKFVSLTQTHRTDNTPNVKGKRNQGVIINPEIDMRGEEIDPEAAKAATQEKKGMQTQQQMQRKQLMLQQQKLQMQKQGKLPVSHG